MDETDTPDFSAEFTSLPLGTTPCIVASLFVIRSTGSISTKSDKSVSAADRNFADFSYVDNRVFSEDGLSMIGFPSVSKEISLSSEDRC